MQGGVVREQGFWGCCDINVLQLREAPRMHPLEQHPTLEVCWCAIVRTLCDPTHQGRSLPHEDLEPSGGRQEGKDQGFWKVLL